MDAQHQVKPNLRGEPWLAAEPLQRVLAALETKGEARIAGGAVRDGLLDRPVSDIDIATTLAPEEVIEVLTKAGIKTVATGLKHGTVTAVAGHGEMDVFQVTTLRVDVETYGRHAKVEFTSDWAEDASRRDFTMNALYCDRHGDLFDPLGGYEDLKHHRVRFVGDARRRIKEDYLRILRFFRFNAVFGGGAFDDEGLEACSELRGGLDHLSHERIRQELMRLLVAHGAVPTAKVMAEYDMFAHLHLRQVDVGRFIRLCAIENHGRRTPDALLRLAALALLGGEDARYLRHVLKLSNEQTERLDVLGSERVKFFRGIAEAEGKALLYRMGRVAFVDAVLFDWAASQDNADDPAWAALLQLPQHWSPPGFPLSGSDLIKRGVKPGTQMGDILKRAEELWIENGFPEDETSLTGCLATAIADCEKKT